jgi:hypothetical protein
MNLRERMFGVRAIPVHEFLGAKGDRTEVERRFFAALLLRNGVYKTTHRNRMDDLLPSLVDQARTLPQPIRVLDAGCSSGISTLELHNALLGAGLTAETIGTDLTIHARYARRGDCAMLFDSRGASPSSCCRSRRETPLGIHVRAGAQLIVNPRVNPSATDD